MAGDAAKAPASYADVLATPEHLVAEVVEGVLYTNPRPGTPHAAATSAIGEELGPPFKRGRGGPGGWILLDEPELHLGADILVPDLAGWRRERLPHVPDAPFLELAPDWACEVLSARTQRLDRMKKVPVYGRERVRHLWLVDPRARTVEILRLDGERYVLLGTWGEDQRARLEPFEAIELDLSVFWADVVLSSEE
ncbi:MAG: Uma2 family endonuclease [Labilithrix sp.]|nr:Uma2 family endonuclease [Labilithrix sp.]